VARTSVLVSRVMSAPGMKREAEVAGGGLFTYIASSPDVRIVPTGLFLTDSPDLRGQDENQILRYQRVDSGS
jgi:hypothetical protein